jgi:hypothetical protein
MAMKQDGCKMVCNLVQLQLTTHLCACGNDEKKHSNIETYEMGKVLTFGFVDVSEYKSDTSFYIILHVGLKLLI